MSDDDKSRKTKEKEKDREERQRVGLVTPDSDEAKELAEWIQRLWRDEKGPAKIDLVPVRGRGTILGDPIDHELFPSPRLIEAPRAAELAIRFIQSAQRNCDRLVHRPQAYAVVPYSTEKGISTTGYGNYPLLMTPKTIVQQRSDGTASGGDDDEQLTQQGLALKYMEANVAAVQFDKTHYASVLGDTINLYRDEVRELREWTGHLMKLNREMHAEVVAAVRSREDALSQAEDRAVGREIRKVKVELVQDGMKTVRNLMIGLFGSDVVPDSSGPHALGPGSNGNGHAQPKYPMTRERQLIALLLEDAEKMGRSIHLFGEWEITDDGTKMKQTKPGVFSAEQFQLLVQVKNGALPTEALDVMLPGSGTSLEITPAKIAEAAPYMTESLTTGLMQIVGLRREAQAKAAAAAAAHAGDATTSSSGTDVPPEPNL